MLDSTVVVHNKYQTKKLLFLQSHTGKHAYEQPHHLLVVLSRVQRHILVAPLHRTLYAGLVSDQIHDRIAAVCVRAPLATSQSATPQPLPNGMNEALSRDGAEQS